LKRNKEENKEEFAAKEENQLRFSLRAIAHEKLEIVLFVSAFGRGGRKGGSGGIPPAEPVNEIGSDFFKYTPHNSHNRSFSS